MVQRHVILPFACVPVSRCPRARSGLSELTHGAIEMTVVDRLFGEDAGDSGPAKELPRSAPPWRIWRKS